MTLRQNSICDCIRTKSIVLGNFHGSKEARLFFQQQLCTNHLDTLTASCCSRPCGGGGTVGLGRTAGRRWSGGSTRPGRPSWRSGRSAKESLTSSMSMEGSTRSTKSSSGGFSHTEEPTKGEFSDSLIKDDFLATHLTSC